MKNGAATEWVQIHKLWNNQLAHAAIIVAVIVKNSFYLSLMHIEDMLVESSKDLILHVINT